MSRYLFAFLALTISSLSYAGTLTKSKRLQTYFSGWSQDYIQGQGMDYISPISITVNNKSFNFMCPGGSFLQGMESYYQDGFRRFRFACSFFDNSQGKPVTKSFAKCNSKGWDNTVYNPGKSTCTTKQFVGGLFGKYSISTAAQTASGADEQFKAVCCEAESPGVTVDVDTCSAPKVFNTAKSAPGMTMCPENQVIQEISTEFKTILTEADRLFTFKCCGLKDTASK